MNRLIGRTALITGAARGIGAGIARRFADEGAALLLVDRLEPELREVVDGLRARGAEVEPVVIELGGADAAHRIRAGATERFESVDILVNNAALGITGSIEDFDHDTWDGLLAVNLTAAFRLARQFVPDMAARGFGRVLNISSMNGLIGMRKDAAYSASKSALHALTRSIAVDYGPSGVTANAIAPGPIVTPLNSQILTSELSWFTRTVVDNKPVPGLGSVDDVAAAAAFLASDEARFISGQVLAVDGGLSATRYVPD